MKRLVLEIDDEIHQQIKRKALEQKKSMREILLELILKWLKWKHV